MRGIIRDLTKQKVAENKANEAQRKLETLIANLPGIAYCCKNDSAWSMEFISSGVQTITGYPSADFTSGKRSYADLIHDEDRKRVWKIVQAALKRKQSFTAEYRLISATDEEKWVWEQGCGVFNSENGTVIALEGFISEITERKKLSERDTRLWKILDESLNEVYIFDANILKFIEVNQGARDNLGYTKEDLGVLTPLDLKTEFTTETFEDLIRPLRVGEKEKVEFTTLHRRKDGSQYPVEVHLQLTDFESKPVFVAIILDITERKRAEKELIKTREDLMLQTLFTQRLSALATMAGGISHELNQPLNSITLYAETIKNYIRDFSSKETSQISDTLQKIIEQSERASQVIEHMRQFASENKQLTVEKIGVRSLIASVLDLVETQLRNHGIEVCVEAQDSDEISANNNRLEQVLINLITNAKDSILEKKSQENEPKRITIAVEREPGIVIIRVSDTGAGIDPLLQNQIFEPFVTTKGPDRGTGLGLAICHGILKDYNATISLEKSDTQGSTFKLVFPVSKN